MQHVFGTYAENSIDQLKEYLAAAQLIDSPAAKLDAVMVEDIDHFYELIAEEGIPLARGEVPVIRPRLRDVANHWSWRTWALLTGMTAALLASLVENALDLLPI